MHSWSIYITSDNTALKDIQTCAAECSAEVSSHSCKACRVPRQPQPSSPAGCTVLPSQHTSWLCISYLSPCHMLLWGQLKRGKGGMSKVKIYAVKCTRPFTVHRKDIHTKAYLQGIVTAAIYYFHEPVHSAQTWYAQPSHSPHHCWEKAALGVKRRASLSHSSSLPAQWW